MERITTDHPKNNVEWALNLFFINEAETYVRGGGAAPDHQDISLYDFIRQIANTHKLSIDSGWDDEEISESLFEYLADGTDTPEGIIATLYTAAWAFSELREVLSNYEKTGLNPNEVTAQGAELMECRAKLQALEKSIATGQLIRGPAGDSLHLSPAVAGNDNFKG